jgi:hypothetical protein
MDNVYLSWDVLVIHLLEDVFEMSVIRFQNCVFGRKIEWILHI